MLVIISKQPCATPSADLKSLAQLLPELYSTQSYFHCLLSSFIVVIANTDIAVIRIVNVIIIYC